jgi:short chain dehydrogenase
VTGAGRQRRGWIVNIASGSALRPRAGASVYSASKGAVIAFTRALALEAAPFGIRANVICPALARTPLLEAFVDDDDPRIWGRARGPDTPWPIDYCQRCCLGKLVALQRVGFHDHRHMPACRRGPLHLTLLRAIPTAYCPHCRAGHCRSEATQAKLHQHQI